MITDEVIDVRSMRHGFMTAVRIMNMAARMAGAAMLGCAAIRVPVAHLYDMLVNVILMGMMQMPVMQVVDVVAMADSGVAVAGAVLMIVIGVMRKGTVRHDVFGGSSSTFGSLPRDLRRMGAGAPQSPCLIGASGS